ncbi:MAG: hypothetical protein PHY14_04925 [Candidatus Gracilibacteria bacterium]|nr:hypothetical protein [Candidatus Gracilibacteria bacterium]
MSTQGTSVTRAPSFPRFDPIEQIKEIREDRMGLGSMRVEGSVKELITHCLADNSSPFSHGTLLVWAYGNERIKKSLALIGKQSHLDMFLGTFLFYFWEEQSEQGKSIIVKATEDMMSKEKNRKQEGGKFFIDFLLREAAIKKKLYQEYIDLIYVCMALFPDEILSEMTFYNQEMKKPNSLLEIVQHYDTLEEAPNENQGKIGKFVDLRDFLEKKGIPPYNERPINPLIQRKLGMYPQVLAASEDIPNHKTYN